jgi:hypothetical protein
MRKAAAQTIGVDGGFPNNDCIGSRAPEAVGDPWGLVP